MPAFCQDTWATVGHVTEEHRARTALQIERASHWREFWEPKPVPRTWEPLGTLTDTALLRPPIRVRHMTW